MTRLANLVALSTACQTAHDDAFAANDMEMAASLRTMGKLIARHIARHVHSRSVTGVGIVGES